MMMMERQINRKLNEYGMVWYGHEMLNERKGEVGVEGEEKGRE